MSNAPDVPQAYDEIHTLVAAQVQNELTPDQHERLEELLAEDAANRELYLDYVSDSISLRYLLGPQDESTDQSVDPNLDAKVTPRRQSYLQWASRHPLRPAIAVAVTVVAALLLAMAAIPVNEWIAERERKPESPQRSLLAKSDFIARLSGWKEAVWLEDTRPPLRDPRLNAGQRLALESGVIEITYLSGTRVVLEGPAEFTVGRAEEQGTAAELARKKAGRGSVEGDVGQHARGGNQASDTADFVLHPAYNSGDLKLGKLVAYVPKLATGFYVDTPFARVEDLGTEFGVEVQASGAADVLVLTGKVDVVQEDPQSGERTRIQLVSQQAAQVSAQGRITRYDSVDRVAIATVRRRLDNSFAPSVGQLRGKLVEIPNASFELPDAGPTFLENISAWTQQGITPHGVANASIGFGNSELKELGAAGNQYAYINQPGTLTSQSVAEVVEGASYTLVVALGRRTDNPGARYILRLLVDGREVAVSEEISGSVLRPGTFKDASLRYIGRVADGSKLSIQLENRADVQANFDNVRLYVGSPITEPSDDDKLGRQTQKQVEIEEMNR